jgi:hypothetical protein
MNLEIITKADLNEIKRQIVIEVVDELKKMFNGATEQEYIKSSAAKKKLRVLRFQTGSIEEEW